MQRFICILAILLPVCLKAQNPLSGGRDIHIQLTPLTNTKVYLGSYYGNTMALFDSAQLDDKSKGTFKSSSKLTGGVYFIVTAVHGYEIQFELLMDDAQHFSIAADTSAKEKAVITGSPENTLFKAYNVFSVAKGRYQEQLKNELKDAKTKADTVRLDKAFAKSNEELNAYRDSLLDRYPASLLSSILHVLKKPEVPAIPVVNGKPDSLFTYHFLKAHYWDNVDFSDDRLLHTPYIVFEKQVDDYFKNYISIEADSIIKEVNYILLAARAGKEMYPYLLMKFTKEYMSPKYMGQDKVFVFLFENFYLKGDTILVSAENRKIISDRAYNLMANQIGLPAAPMNFVDTAGKVIPLYSIKADFTVVAFWDPTCGHCKIEIPRLDSIYRAKWKGLGVAIYAVNSNPNDNELPLWKKYISDNNLAGWIHTRESKEIREAAARANQMNFRQAYDMFSTPTLFLLDKDKRIIAKKLTIEQFDELIKLKKGSKS